MLNPAQNHYKTLKSFRDSAEYVRASLPSMNPQASQVGQSDYGPQAEALDGQDKIQKTIEPKLYRVRMEDSEIWIECASPPKEGAAEWLHVDESGKPIYYWSKETRGLTLLG